MEKKNYSVSKYLASNCIPKFPLTFPFKTDITWDDVSCDTGFVNSNQHFLYFFPLEAELVTPLTHNEAMFFSFTLIWIMCMILGCQFLYKLKFNTFFNAFSVDTFANTDNEVVN